MVLLGGAFNLKLLGTDAVTARKENTITVIGSVGRP